MTKDNMSVDEVLRKTNRFLIKGEFGDGDMDIGQAKLAIYKAISAGMPQKQELTNPEDHESLEDDTARIEASTHNDTVNACLASIRKTLNIKEE